MAGTMTLNLKTGVLRIAGELRDEPVDSPGSRAMMSMTIHLELGLWRGLPIKLPEIRDVLL